MDTYYKYWPVIMGVLSIGVGLLCLFTNIGLTPAQTAGYLLPLGLVMIASNTRDKK